ncbi:MAG: NAD(P)-binding oxidoreductase [Paraglaciecola sp.]|uniref:NAD(P)-dependent oxidoreductase n=1 Tax=Paraglaciecola sp. TaxID=1920173 RepID=UPI0032998569
MNKVLVLGASGATGKLVVSELLQRNVEVVSIVRASSSLLDTVANHPNYSEILADVASLNAQELTSHLIDCSAVVSCLGHNLTFKGMYGKPRRLVTDTIKTVTEAIQLLAPPQKIKIILMNTTGNSNRDIPEKPPVSQRMVISILRYLIPPHLDNEQAADFLRTTIGQQHPLIEWTAVRPDSLTNESKVSAYTVHASPTRNAIFDSAPTSRENVANFMAELITNPQLWATWKGNMPVIYNDM